MRPQSNKHKPSKKKEEKYEEGDGKEEKKRKKTPDPFLERYQYFPLPLPVLLASKQARRRNIYNPVSRSPGERGKRKGKIKTPTPPLSFFYPTLYPHTLPHVPHSYRSSSLSPCNPHAGSQEARKKRKNLSSKHPLTKTKKERKNPRSASYSPKITRSPRISLPRVSRQIRDNQVPDLFIHVSLSHRIKLVSLPRQTIYSSNQPPDLKRGIEREKKKKTYQRTSPPPSASTVHLSPSSHSAAPPSRSSQPARSPRLQRSGGT